ncbi:Rieske 2Fe-2S domain-containing protein [bacterium]|nr:Rieske 2Fe-2S domain-containing protein [bacterium]
MSTKFWHLVGHVCQVALLGEYFVFPIGDIEIVVYRFKGEIRVFQNTCPHRGSKLFVADSGCSPIVCPYHGWSFGDENKVSIPLYKTFKSSPVDPRSASLQYWQVRIIGGFIFIAYDPIFSLELQLGTSVFSLVESIGSSIHCLFSLNSFDFQSNWRIAIENSLEAYHVSMIHSKTLARLGIDYGTNSFFDWSSVLHHSISNKRISSSLKLAQKFLDGVPPVSDYCSIYIFPFSSLSSTCSIGFSLQNYFPSPSCSSLNSTRFRSLLFSPCLRNSSSQISPLESFMKSADSLNRDVFIEDSSVCSLLPISSWSSSSPKYVSSLEKKILHFRSLFSKLSTYSSFF